MTQPRKIKLYSYRTAPMVQPVVIALLEKGIKFDVEYVNAYDKPEWFYALGPTAKLPLVEVDGIPLFESSVINEYLDETFGPRLLPEDPVLRAQNRAWTLYAFGVLLEQGNIMMVRRSEEYEAGLHTVLESYAKIEIALRGPYFNGEDISLVDFTYAPILVRQDILDRHYGTNVINQFEKISTWAKLLIERPSVKSSVPEDFEKTYLAGALDSYLSKERAGGLSLGIN